MCEKPSAFKLVRGVGKEYKSRNMGYFVVSVVFIKFKAGMYLNS